MSTMDQEKNTLSTNISGAYLVNSEGALIILIEIIRDAG